MKIEQVRPGVFLATGEFNGIPFISEGKDWDEAFQGAVEIMKRRACVIPFPFRCDVATQPIQMRGE